MSDEHLTPGVSFRLVRFNPRRALRKAPAAEVEIADADNSVRLWMSVADIEANVRDYGPHPGLLAAREAYRRKVEIREGNADG